MAVGGGGAAGRAVVRGGGAAVRAVVRGWRDCFINKTNYLNLLKGLGFCPLHERIKDTYNFTDLGITECFAVGETLARCRNIFICD